MSVNKKNRDFLLLLEEFISSVRHKCGYGYHCYEVYTHIDGSTKIAGYTTYTREVSTVFISIEKNVLLSSKLSEIIRTTKFDNICTGKNSVKKLLFNELKYFLRKYKIKELKL